MQSLCVHPHVDTDDFVVACAGLGVDLACEESCSVGRDVPAVLQEEPLQVVHLFTDPLAGAQSLLVREGQDLMSPQGTLKWIYKIKKQLK